jgi:hypothetical protein
VSASPPDPAVESLVVGLPPADVSWVCAAAPPEAVQGDSYAQAASVQALIARTPTLTPTLTPTPTLTLTPTPALTLILTLALTLTASVQALIARASQLSAVAVDLRCQRVAAAVFDHYARETGRGGSAFSGQAPEPKPRAGALKMKADAAHT